MSLRYSFWSKMVVVPVVNYCHSAPNQTFTSPSAPVWWRPVNTWSSVRWPRLTLPVELSLHGSNEHPSPGSCRAHGPAALGGIAHSTFLWAASPSTLVKAFPASFQNTERLWGRLLLDHQRAYFQRLPWHSASANFSAILWAMHGYAPPWSWDVSLGYEREQGFLGAISALGVMAVHISATLHSFL